MVLSSASSEYQCHLETEVGTPVLEVQLDLELAVFEGAPTLDIGAEWDPAVSGLVESGYWSTAQVLPIEVVDSAKCVERALPGRISGD